MLAPEELVSLREVGEDALSGRCDIRRKVRVRQPNASWKDSVETVLPNLPCRKVPTGNTPEEQAVMQTTLAARGVSTFIIGGEWEVFADDVLRYPAGVGKEYGIAGTYVRTDGIYMRVVVYDDSKQAPPTP